MTARHTKPRTFTQRALATGAALAVTATALTLAIPGTTEHTIGAETASAFTAQSTGKTVLTTRQWLVTAPTALALSNSTARVTWTPAEGHTAYTVQRSTSPTFASAVSTSNVTGTELNVTGLAKNTTYYFRARGKLNNSLPWSAVASAKTGPGSSVKKVALLDSADIRHPHGITVDSADRVWAVDYIRGEIVRVGADGSGKKTVLRPNTLPTYAMRQLVATSDVNEVAVVVTATDQTESSWSPSKDGIYTVKGYKATSQASNGGAYGVGHDEATDKFYYAGAGPTGADARTLYECTAAWSCTKIWESPVWMSYLSMPSGSDELVIGTSTRIYTFNVKTREASVVASLGGDTRGVFSPSKNLYFVADYTDGNVWRLSYDPATGATNSALILSDLPKSRGMAATKSGDLIVANSSSAGDVALRGVWKYPGLGK